MVYIQERDRIMYITRFTGTDTGAEDFLYRTEQEAKDYLLLFQNDDSGLFDVEMVQTIPEKNCTHFMGVL